MQDFADFAERTPSSAFVALALATLAFVIQGFGAGLVIVYPFLVVAALGVCAALDGIARKERTGISWFALLLTLSPIVAFYVVRLATATSDLFLLTIEIVLVGVPNAAIALVCLRGAPGPLRVGSALLALLASSLIVVVSGVLIRSRGEDFAARLSSFILTGALLSLAMNTRRVVLSWRKRASRWYLRATSAIEIVVGSAASLGTIFIRHNSIVESEGASTLATLAVTSPRVGLIVTLPVLVQGALWLRYGPSVATSEDDNDLA